MKTILYSELRTEAIDRELACDYTPDPGLTFEVSPEVVTEKDRMIIKGFLSNPLSEMVEIVVAEVGKMGFSIDLFQAEPLKYIGEMYPPCPPRPLKIFVPPETTVEFREFVFLESGQVPGSPTPSNRDRTCLTDYEYSGSPTVELKWSFCYWSGTRPEGIVPITLPNR